VRARSEGVDEMSALISEWRERAAQAERWNAGEDPEPVLEVLALSVALELTGDLAELSSVERDRLRKVGQRALLHVGGPMGEADEDELDALRMSASIARDGLRALSSRALPAEETPSLDVRITIPPGDVVRLLSGRLDGFAAGSLAMRIRRSERATAELRMLRRASAPEERKIALAAADSAAVLDPSGGRRIGLLEALGAEAVLFEGMPRRLAVYAEEPAPLRVVAPELTTEDVREGYWIGRVADGAQKIDAVVHAGDRSERWVLDLDERSS
jgi:hypothetical protein